MRNIILLILTLHWDRGNSDVSQVPSVLMAVKGSSVQLNCTHKKDSTFNQMYWYRQRPGQTMTLIVFTSTYDNPDYGDSDKHKFPVIKTVAESGSLTVNNVESDDSAVYFCSFITAEILTLLQRADMMNTFLIRSACLLWLTVANHAKTVLQSPDDLVKSQTESAVIFCSHNIQSYNRMLWYKQSQDMTGLKLMGYLYTNENIEPEFKDKIKLEGDAARNGSLTISNLKPEDSAVYFCAAYYTVI
ncbi:hypothetical protein G5714_017312 [Onychostoma macrolepis]|uniref:Ig-like domain-containing protein n=1 Tax=Onychostoma macrolepis TaxID=369639 RepID=A0A7J6C9L6_9TELE|nr:hypothetical protein G5714_017312 [Onychostoma macrolepis]